MAFTAAYAYGFDLLARMTERLSQKSGNVFSISIPLKKLLTGSSAIWGNPDEMRKKLFEYCADAEQVRSWVIIDAEKLTCLLYDMSHWLRSHIAAEEWIGDGVDLHWYNSYYDNSGRRVEGLKGETVRMMLTGQVFTILSGTADDSRVREIIRAADWYLFQPQRGGYCLNTDFGEVKLDMGRMFGFAYGNKENGAVFCHMSVMYAYALYVRGFALEGWKVLRQLYKQCDGFSVSEILPGIPEYYDIDGRGMYPYLTGAASWFMLTLQTQVFGIRGCHGDLLIEPKLLAEQFDSQGNSEIYCTAAGKKLHVRYENPSMLEYGSYRIGRIICGKKHFSCGAEKMVISRRDLPLTDETCDVTVTLEAAGKRGGDINV